MRLCDPTLESVRRHADRVAVVAPDRTLTYRELGEESARVASAIADSGTTSKHVGLLAYRSWSAYAGVLGVLRSGRAYVPLNPRFPAARNAYMLERAEVDTVVLDATQLAAHAELLATCSPLRIVTDVAALGELADTLRRHTVIPLSARDDVDVDADLDAIAYVMFTSGTTGQPKGVGVTHRNALSYMTTMRRRYGFAPEDRFSQMFDLTFDLSVHDLFLCWGAGAALHVVPEADVMMPAKFIRDHQLTVWFSVPSAVSLMRKLRVLRPAAFSTLRISLFCGEALPTVLAEAWQAAAPTSIVENIYGPTEATIAITAHRFSGSSSTTDNGVVPIGEPIDGQDAIVVDDKLRPVPDGELGELLLGGDQIAPGYLGDPAQTVARFVELEVGAGRPRRWYRTGDLVRRDPPPIGLVFIGRVDSQIKIMGYRVELGEIENAVATAAGTDVAIAIPWPVTPEGVGGVVAFVTSHAVPLDRVRDLVAGRLPAYMVPSTIHVIDRFPLNANGKIDRRALQERLNA